LGAHTTAFRNDLHLFGRGSLRTTTSSYKRIWFTGAYSYYLSEDTTNLGRYRMYAEKARYLLGFELTAEVLYELAPWSWLIDWFTNLGTLVSNATKLSQDGLVIRWGYLMTEQVNTVTYTLSGVRSHDLRTTLGPSTLTLSTTRKSRVKASPYGFGLNPSSFTARQWSILAALGMTRAPRVAW
jgi:hypothetical protein